MVWRTVPELCRPGKVKHRRKIRLQYQRGKKSNKEQISLYTFKHFQKAFQSLTNTHLGHESLWALINSLKCCFFRSGMIVPHTSLITLKIQELRAQAWIYCRFSFDHTGSKVCVQALIYTYTHLNLLISGSTMPFNLLMSCCLQLIVSFCQNKNDLIDRWRSFKASP